MKKLYKATVMSPIHIGNGNKISSLEYFVDSKFVRINMNSLFSDEKFDREGFVKDVEMGLTRLEERYRSVAEKHKLYELDISTSAKTCLHQTGGEVAEFTKTRGGFFIPGSSIKGAVRTALLWYILKNDENIRSEMEMHLLDVIRGKRVRRERVDDEIEKMVFGENPTTDLLKVLHIPDTDILPHNLFRIENVKILSTRKVGYGWKRFSIPVEALRVGSRFRLTMEIDEFFEDEKVLKEIGFEDKISYLSELEKICKEFSSMLIDYEIDFFNRCNVDGGLNNIIEFYKRLRDEKGILLRMSWGSGWHSMTVGTILGDDIMEQLRRRYQLGRRRNPPEYVKPYPKTRKLVFESDKPAYPMGWLKLEVLK